MKANPPESAPEASNDKDASTSALTVTEQEEWKNCSAERTKCDTLTTFPVVDDATMLSHPNPFADHNLKGNLMETLIVFSLITWIAYAFYRTGKRTGSISGFNVGRRRGRFRRR